MDESKDRLDDLASLFIPDILHHVPSPNQLDTTPSGVSVKQEDYDFNHSGQKDVDDMESPQGHKLSQSDANTVAAAGMVASGPPAGQSSLNNNYNNFISNNNFISSASGLLNVGQAPLNQQYQQQYNQSQQYYNPYDSNQHMNGHGHHHSIKQIAMYGMASPYNQILLNQQGSPQQPQLQQSQQPQQLAQNQFQQPQQFYQHLHHPQQSHDEQYAQFMHFQQSFGLHPSNSNSNLNSAKSNRDLNWLSNNSLDNMMLNNGGAGGAGASGASGESSVYRTNPSFVSDKIPTPDPGDSMADNMEDQLNSPALENSEPAKKKIKIKIRKRDIKGSEYQIDYAARKCRALLDFKKVAELSTDPDSYKIIDKDNNEVNVDFKGFLNGRLLTNDTDNNNYIFAKHSSKNEDESDEKAGKSGLVEMDDFPDNSVKQDPRVLSCYRRNYIQISVNMNISGLKSNSKLFRVRSSEYGYSITRVIKYFKIEVSASSSASNSRSVPLFIKSAKEKDSNEKDTGKKDDDSTIKAAPINSREHIIILNDDTEIENNEIDKYFIIKKLQFKSATPNNGNLTFQNYYHLHIKLTAIVADLYYDDYVDEDFNNGIGSGVGDDEGQGAGNSDNSNEIVLYELVSEPIIVRGRNPNFYSERNDILIKGRPPNEKNSFKAAGNSDLDENDEDMDLNPVSASNAVEPTLKSTDKPVVEATGSVEPPQPVNDINDENEEVSSAVESSVEEDFNSQQLSRNHQVSSGSSNRSDSKHSSVPPSLAYSGTNSTAIDLKSVNRYKYFPISNVYYLPPINAVYFPHGAHQQNYKEPDSRTPQAEPIVSERRKSSNVYFR